MKKRVLAAKAAALKQREMALRAMFLGPVMSVTAWDVNSADMAGSYIGLLHSEVENTVESIVRDLLANARAKTAAYRCDPLLANCCVFYGNEFRSKLGPKLLPSAAQLRSSQADLLSAWDLLGANLYFESMIEANHGAGVKYIERMFHPMGLAVTKDFKRVEGAGIRLVHNLDGLSTTMLTEFARLRGSAVHTGTAKFRSAIKDDSPQAIEKRGEGAVLFVEELARTLMRAVW